MRKSKLVALHGYPGTGKDTIADCLASVDGYRKVSFADALYAELAAVFETSTDFLKSREAKTQPQDALATFHATDPNYRSLMAPTRSDLFTPRTSRYHLDGYGTLYMQSRGTPRRWVDKTLARMDALEGKDIVIPDLRRYADLREILALRHFARGHEYDLHVIHLTRPSRPVGWAAGLDLDSPIHDVLPDTFITDTVQAQENDISGAVWEVRRILEAA